MWWTIDLTSSTSLWAPTVAEEEETVALNPAWKTPCSRFMDQSSAAAGAFQLSITSEKGKNAAPMVKWPMQRPLAILISHSDEKLTECEKVICTENTSMLLLNEGLLQTLFFAGDFEKERSFFWCKCIGVNGYSNKLSLIVNNKFLKK